MAESALRQYEYGGEGLFGFLMPERREILSPEQQLLQGYESTRRGPAAVVETIPAKYGEPEIDFEYTPVVRGIKSALNAVQDFFTSPPTVEQAKETSASALRGIDQYMKDQYTAGALGGRAYNPETGQVAEFDPTVAMVGGAPAGGSQILASGSKQGTGVALGSALRGIVDSEDEYIKLINPKGQRIQESARPNLMMGDMYGMLPRESNYLREMDIEGFGPVQIYESGGDIYVTGYNPDVGEQDVIGYMIGRGDSTELAVVEELQGKGIGSEISYEFRSRNPTALSGGLTEAGEKTARSAYRRMKQEKNN